MHYRNEIVGPVPELSELEKLDNSELAVWLVRDGMLTMRGQERAEYLRIQLAHVRTNLMEARLEQQVTVNSTHNTLNVYGSNQDVENQRSALRAHIRGELARRGVDLDAVDRIGLSSDSVVDSPPEAG